MRPSHRNLSAWYHQLAQQLEAGLPLPAALRSSRGTGAPAAGLEAMAQTVEAGGSVDDALRRAETWLPLADILALSAAVGAGRMPHTLRNLSARHAQIGSAKLRTILACLYPLLVLHIGLLLLPVLRMIDWEKGFQWNGAAYARGLATTLVPLWAVIVALALLARRQSPVLGAIARRLPVLGRYVRAQALADLSFTLANLLEAGVPIGQAWAVAGLIARSPELKAAAAAMEATVARGAPPGPQLAAWPCFPPAFVALYQTGEATGQLEANLHRLTAQHQDTANRALTFATLLYPGLMFLAVAAMVVYYVVTFYAGYFKMIGDLAK